MNDTLELLKQVKEGTISPEKALLSLKMAPFENLGYAKPDYHRRVRQGAHEVIYGAGKTPGQIIGILTAMGDKGLENIMVTRIAKDEALTVQRAIADFRYHPEARLGVAFGREREGRGLIVVASGGTCDLPVCEEAAVTAETLGHKVTRLYDVGVSGLHRLLAHAEVLMQARVIVAVAGMEGALPGVLAGLCDCPVIAVPTAVGYGANFGGLSALLTMLNACAPGVSVVNIDNGFGAGYLAAMINGMD